MKLKRLLSSVLAIIMMINVVNPSVFAGEEKESEWNFNDVKKSDWFYDDVKFVKEQNLMKGVSESDFMPNGLASRAMIVAVLYRMDGTPKTEEKETFRDVEKDKWYNDAVNWASEKKIVSGYSDDTFKPDANITRQDLATILYQYSAYKKYDVDSETDISVYEDADKISDYALDSILWANKNKIITGQSDTILAPKANATRAEIASIFARYYKKFHLGKDEIKEEKLPEGRINDKQSEEQSTASMPSASGSSGGSSSAANPSASESSDNKESNNDSSNLDDSNSDSLHSDAKEYKLNISAEKGGKISEDIQEQYKYGDLVDVLALADEGYTFDKWTATNIKLDDEESFALQFMMPNTEVSLVASFKPLEKNTLSNEVKTILGLNRDLEDNDGDGLSDYFEYKYLGTDLLSEDSDKNGVSDADEDEDNDGLSNIKEQDLGTKPNDEDTDNDGLSDFDEVVKYKTDPLRRDTDSDSIKDGSEVKLGLDPMKKMTDGKTLDSEVPIEQKLEDRAISDEVLNFDSAFKPSISGTVPRDLSSNVYIDFSDSDLLENNPSVLSGVLYIENEYTQPLTLSFDYSENGYSGNINNLFVLQFGEDLLIDNMELLEVSVDEENQIVSTEIEGQGVYCLVDLDEFLKVLGIDVFANIKEEKANEVRLNFSDDEFLDEAEEDNLQEDDSKDLEEVGEVDEDKSVNDISSQEKKEKTEEINEEKKEGSNEKSDEKIEVLAQNTEDTREDDNKELESSKEEQDNEIKEEKDNTLKKDELEGDTDKVTEVIEERREDREEKLYKAMEEVSTKESNNKADDEDIREKDSLEASEEDDIYGMDLASFASLNKSKFPRKKADILFFVDNSIPVNVSSPYEEIRRNQELEGNIINASRAAVNRYNIDFSFGILTYMNMLKRKNIALSDYDEFDAYDISYLDHKDSLPDGAFSTDEFIEAIPWRTSSKRFVIIASSAPYPIVSLDPWRSSDVEVYIRALNNLKQNDMIFSAATDHTEEYGDLIGGTGGFQKTYDQDFTNELLNLLEAFNDDSKRIILDNLTAVELNDPPYKIIKDNHSSKDDDPIADTDGDGLNDEEELISYRQKDVNFFVKALLKNHKVPYDLYIGKDHITVWSFKSNPVLVDTDYDGIPDGDKDYDGSEVTPDINPRDNVFGGKLRGYEGPQLIEPVDVEFKVDYRAFFKDNNKYYNDLAVLGSIFASLAYVESTSKSNLGEESYWKNYDKGISLKKGTELDGGMSATLDKFGFKKIENHKLENLTELYKGDSYNGDKSYLRDDLSEVYIGHREIEQYTGYNKMEKKILIVACIRGTNGTIEEWSSNFDIGHESDNYPYKENPFWKNKKNHKGFDVASNIIDNKIQEYIDALERDNPVIKNSKKSIFIVGHSRGAAIANILGSIYEDKSDFESYTYTYASPNTTTLDSVNENYHSIFNIVNEDDIVTMMPLSAWGFRRYGKTKPISVEKEYEHSDISFRLPEKGTWEYLTKCEYDSNGNLVDAIESFKKIVPNRTGLYVYPDSDDCIEEGLLKSQYNSNRRLVPYFEIVKQYKKSHNAFVDGGIEYIDIKQKPAYVLMVLADFAANITLIKYDVAPRYEDAKKQFILAALPNYGGMVHPHLPETYYLIVKNKVKALRR